MENNRFKLKFIFTNSDINLFAEISGDKNPIHLDEEYAKGTIFKKPIIHGMLGASIFSRILGMDFPGKGTIYLKQDLKFLAPMFIDIEYEAVVEITEILKDKRRAILKTQILDAENKLIIDGQALVQNDKFGL